MECLFALSACGIVKLHVKLDLLQERNQGERTRGCLYMKKVMKSEYYP